MWPWHLGWLQLANIYCGKQFYKNRIGIAIEHGQDIAIDRNKFDGIKKPSGYWARNTQPSDWGYAKYRDTRSRNYTISNNVFSDDNSALNVTLTDHVEF